MHNMLDIYFIIIGNTKEKGRTVVQSNEVVMRGKLSPFPLLHEPS